MSMHSGVSVAGIRLLFLLCAQVCMPPTMQVGLECVVKLGEIIEACINRTYAFPFWLKLPKCLKLVVVLIGLLAEAMRLILLVPQTKL